MNCARMRLLFIDQDISIVYVNASRERGDGRYCMLVSLSI